MNPNGHGLQIAEITPDNFIFGDNKLGDAPINPSADWSGWLPDNAFQNLNGIEPYACATFGTLACVETMERQEYGATTNYSKRFLAGITGTAAMKGNNPQVIAEALRTKGCVEEKELPFDDTITTFEKFYAPIAQYLYTLAIGTFAEWAFGHSYVPLNAPAMMSALQYSPLGFSCYAWVKDANGLYYRPQGETDEHWVMCYGFKENEYWEVFDSYMDNGIALKKVRWDSIPQQCKRYTLHRQVVNETAWTKFIKLIRQICGLS